jgi:hypothetical protein
VLVGLGDPTIIMVLNGNGKGADMAIKKNFQVTTPSVARHKRANCSGTK